MKLLEKFLDAILWAIFILIGAAYFLTLYTYQDKNVVRFEIPEKTEKFTYTYVDEKGKKSTSYYYLAWFYPADKDPVLALYDPTYNEGYGVKEKQIEKLLPKIGEPEYPVWLRKLWYYAWDGLVNSNPLVCILLLIPLIIPGLLIMFVGGFCRDCLLFVYAKLSNKFENYAYYVNDKEKPFRSYLVPPVSTTIDSYITKNEKRLAQRYNPEFVQLILKFLNKVKSTKNTEIIYYLNYEDLIINQQQHLMKQYQYWEEHLESTHDPIAAENLVSIKQMLNTSYETNIIHISEDVCAHAISCALNTLFADILGNQIFKFKAEIAPHDLSRLQPNEIYIKAIIKNKPGVFAIDSETYGRKNFFTILPKLQIFQHIGNGSYNTLWDGLFVTKCSYRQINGVVDNQSFYNTMAFDTINTLAQEFKR